MYLKQMLLKSRLKYCVVDFPCWDSTGDRIPRHRFLDTLCVNPAIVKTFKTQLTMPSRQTTVKLIVPATLTSEQHEITVPQDTAVLLNPNKDEIAAVVVFLTHNLSIIFGLSRCFCQRDKNLSPELLYNILYRMRAQSTFRTHFSK